MKLSSLMYEDAKKITFAEINSTVAEKVVPTGSKINGKINSVELNNIIDHSRIMVFLVIDKNMAKGAIIENNIQISLLTFFALKCKSITRSNICISETTIQCFG